MQLVFLIFNVITQLLPLVQQGLSIVKTVEATPGLKGYEKLAAASAELQRATGASPKDADTAAQLALLLTKGGTSAMRASGSQGV